MLGECATNFDVKYLSFRQCIRAKPVYFIQLQVGELPKGKTSDLIAETRWSHAEFPYYADLEKHMVHKGVDAPIYKRRAIPWKIKVACLLAPDSEKHTLSQVMNDSSLLDGKFPLSGVTLWMVLSMLKTAPRTYRPLKL
jgi:hypothetical protein